MPVVVTVATNGGLDLRWATLYNLLANATIQDSAISTEFTAVVTGQFDGNDADVRFVVAGNGLTFSGTFPAIELTGGTVEGITIQTEAGITLATFAGFAIDAATLAAALDTYTAGGPGTLDPSALDAIFRVLSYDTTGGGGNDTLEGGNFSDSIFGAAGNDIAIGGAGADTLDGGAGAVDRASYITSAVGLTVDLLIPANNTGDAAGDTYVNIEGLEGSNFNDHLRGNNSNNFLIGGIGADTLDGRGGADSAAYITATAGVTASLANTAANTGDAAGDTYVSIENLSGSNFDDILIGDATNNFLSGRGGADALDGGGGFDTADYVLSTVGLTVDLDTPGNNTGEATGDTYSSIENLRGSGFADILRGDSGNNLLDGQAGGDVLDGGAGFDYAWYNTNSTGTGVTASLNNAGINTGDAAGDTYLSIEGLVGSNVADTLIGDAGNNFLRGQGGADILDGGTGADYADYSNSTIGITVDLANPLNNTGEAAGDVYISIERLRGSAFNDELRGNTGNNTLRGGLGADTLDGGAGIDFASYSDSSIGLTASLANAAANTGEAAGDTYISIESLRGGNFADTLIGDAGDNFLNGGLGADVLDGGAGNDYADYFDSTIGVSVDLASSLNNTGEAEGDTYISIERVRGSAFDDVLRGNAGNNTLRGGLGADVLNGGDGNDFASYSDSSIGLTASLASSIDNTGEAVGDIYISIENLRGGDFADTLTGNSVTNFLQGGPSGDALNGGDGFDFADYFNSTSGVIVDLGNASNNTGEAAGDTFVSIEGIRGSAFDDVLRGDNVLNGGTAVNELIGGLGADTLDGGGGFDFADYRDSTSGLTVSLANPGSNTGEAADDIFISIEGIIGSNLADTLVGNDVSNFLAGGLGADALDGGLDIDYASYLRSFVGLTVSLANPSDNTGEAVGDTYTSIEGIRGSDFGDILIGDGADNFLAGGRGGDGLDGGSGSDTAYYQLWTAQVGLVANLANSALNTGEAAGDTYSSIENLWGSLFSDTLVGDGNDNVLTGVGGDDTLQGNAGNDTLDGGDGSDTAVFLANLADYAITQNLDGSFNIADTRAGTPDGVDAAFNIELFQFADGTVAAGELLNQPPAITSNGGGDTAAVSVAENGTAVTIVAATDSDAGQTLTFSIVGGADAGLFTIDGSTGALAFALAPDFEAPADANADNIYEVTVQVSDNAGGIDTQAIAVTVTNVAGVSPPASNAAIITGTGEEDVLTGLNGSNTVRGLAGNDTLNGAGGADTLDGGSGADAMAGGGGGDTYVVDHLGDTVTELQGQGTDLVQTSLGQYALGLDIENLIFTGAATFDGTGNTLANVITSGAGNDRLDGKAGADTLRGGAGDDTYVVDRPGDTIQEAANNGIDSVEVVGGSNYALAANVENLTYLGDYSGISRFTADGNGLANIITGGNGVDTLNGAGGNDKLLGLAGDDLLFGGAGADRLDGGAGNDRLTGDAGKDTFVFRPGYGTDRILDFSASGSNSDFVEIARTPYASFAELQAAGAISQVGGNVVVTLGADTLTINGVTIENVANDFLFVT